MTTVQVRTPDGSMRQLRLDDYVLHKPLRLGASPPPQSSLVAALPGDVIRRIFHFLPSKQEDWLAADSSCRSWRHAAMPLWENQRSAVAALIACQRRVQRKWRKLEGFVDRSVLHSLQGPASLVDIRELEQLVHPFRIPDCLTASLQVHNGQQEQPQVGLVSNVAGLYLGARLLSVREIMHMTEKWQLIQEWMDNTVLPPTLSDETVMRIPLFSANGPRQIAMELLRNAPTTGNDQKDDSQVIVSSGRIVLVSASAPWAPHFRVLARSWEDFLTLV